MESISERTQKIHPQHTTHIVQDADNNQDGHASIQLEQQPPLQFLPRLSATKLSIQVQSGLRISAMMYPSRLLPKSSHGPAKLRGLPVVRRREERFRLFLAESMLRYLFPGRSKERGHQVLVLTQKQKLPYAAWSTSRAEIRGFRLS